MNTVTQPQAQEEQTGAVQQSSIVNQVSEALPDGWSAAYTPDGKVYYQNHITQHTQWDKPSKQV